MVSEDSRSLSEGSGLSCWFSAPLTLSLPDSLGRVVEDPSGFPAYSRLLTAPSLMRGAAPPACLGAFLP
jgi:hypothetical protein